MLVCGVDIGGTFTDLALFDGDGAVLTEKVLTTPADPSLAVQAGLEKLVARLNGRGAQDARVVHATTLVTNAVIERKGARTALVTTAGFRDVLDLRRENRYDIFDLALPWPLPIVPLELRWEVHERISADGEVLRSPDRDEVRAVAREIAAAGVESIAVVLLHAYAHGQHERQLREWLTEDLPGVAISLSSEVAPQIREYERSCTTAVNAYAAPLVRRYLDTLHRRVAAVWDRSSVTMMVSNGGTCSLDTAQRYPVRLLESGPAAGTLAAQHHGREAGRPDVLAFDMGGTTAKLSIIRDGQPGITTRFETAHAARFRRGSGIPVCIPSIDLLEIGAGGGSIAEVDALGLLQVGPRSAGADPGPACYGFGGAEPTVTDADLALGYLDPGYFLGGSMTLDADRAAAAIGDRVAAPLGLPVLRAAWGIHDLVNENMAVAARLHLANAGLDPRRFTLTVTGGAGPLHALRLAEKLEIRHVICPATPGVGSAYGLVIAPPRADVAHSFLVALPDVDWGELEATLDELAAAAVAMLEDADAATVERTAEMAYVGQTHEIEVPLPRGRLGPECAAAIGAAFDARYSELYGAPVQDATQQLVSLRVTARGRSLSVPPPSSSPAPARAELPRSRRVSLTGGQEHIDVPIHYRWELRPGARYEGPAVIAASDSSVVVDPGWEFWVDDRAIMHLDHLD